MTSFQKRRGRTGIFVVLSFMVASCNLGAPSREDPKGRLTEYISKTFNIDSVEDKKELLDYLTGDARARLAGWKDEEFKVAFIQSKRKFLKLLFKEVKTISPDEAHLTYELSYTEEKSSEKGQSNESTVTNKKFCRMLKENGKWFIGEVRNIKELVEFKNELTLP